MVRGDLWDGDAIPRLEAAFAEFIGTPDAVAVPSGRAGLRFIFDALDLPKGSEILFSAFGYPVVPHLARTLGYDVKFVDCELETMGMDPEKLAAAMSDRTRAVLVTHLYGVPCRIAEIAEIVHSAGGLLYLDGANLNASLGVVRPGDVGFDVMHFNLHKTFSTPHGGGGPGSGPVGVKSFLAGYLPTPVARRDERKARGFEFDFDYDRPKSIGKVHSVYGNFLVAVKAYAYILTLGPAGLRRVAENAVLNANYLQKKLEPLYDLPYKGLCQHEFVLSATRQKEHGVRALDIAKRLLDYGLHAPTVYFPLIVKEALMVEPTETESRASLDRFVDVMAEIAAEAERSPELVKGAPTETPVSRLDESRAAKELNVTWQGR